MTSIRELFRKWLFPTPEELAIKARKAWFDRALGAQSSREHARNPQERLYYANKHDGCQAWVRHWERRAAEYRDAK